MTTIGDHPHHPGNPDAAHAIDGAVELLASLRGLYHHGGPAVAVHLLSALHHQLLRDLLDAVIAAHNHGYTPDQIAQLAGLDLT